MNCLLQFCCFTMSGTHRVVCACVPKGLSCNLTTDGTAGAQGTVLSVSVILAPFIVEMGYDPA